MAIQTLRNIEEKMHKTVEGLKKELVTIRTGRATPTLIEHIKIEYAGVPTPLNQMAGISEYVVLRSETLGWKGRTSLIEDGVQGSDRIRISSTAGLHPGEDFYMRQSDLYTIKAVLDEHTLQLVYPLSRNYDSSHSYYGTVSFSGGWIKDTSNYTELARVSETGQIVTRLLFMWKSTHLQRKQESGKVISSLR